DLRELAAERLAYEVARIIAHDFADRDNSLEPQLRDPPGVGMAGKLVGHRWKGEEIFWTVAREPLDHVGRRAAQVERIVRRRRTRIGPLHLDLAVREAAIIHRVVPDAGHGGGIVVAPPAIEALHHAGVGDAHQRANSEGHAASAGGAGAATDSHFPD